MTTRKKEAKQRVSIYNMSVDAIESKPIDIDWSTGYGEAWECFEASSCDKCGETIAVGIAVDSRHKDEDNSSECDGVLAYAEGPMMNYGYPINFRNDSYSVEDAVKKIAHLPLCIVEFQDTEAAGHFAGKIFLALTGGGQNLSWEICEAYMCLGFLPPVHFELPSMCGRGASEKDKWIASGCLKSNEVAVRRSQSRIERIKSALVFGRKYEREQRK